MTLNISVACPQFVCQVSDRRFITIPDCKPYDDKNKATVVVCKDAMLLVSYHGIGSVRSTATDSWIADQFRGIDSRDLTASDVEELIRDRATSWFRQIKRSSVSDTNWRHSFVIAGKPHQGFPFLTLVSNYESVEPSDESSLAKGIFGISKKHSSRTKLQGLIGGCHQEVPQDEKDLLLRLFKLKGGSRNRGPRIEDIVNVIVRAIRRTSLVSQSVGPNCMSIFIASGKSDAQARYHPEGLPSTLYAPNYINGIIITGFKGTLPQGYSITLSGPPPKNPGQ